MKKIAIVLSLLTSTLGYAADFSDMATVKRVTPRYIEINRPISSCQTTSEVAPPKEKGVAGAIIGGVAGGLLVQDKDLGVVDPADIKVVTKREPTEQEFADLLFAWKVGKFVKSNAIVYCKNGQTIGVGAGQMSRVYSAKIAGIKAADEGLEVPGSALASDAFFPFRDGIDAAAEAGITAIIQPGGSVRDNEVIAAADQHNIAMVFTGMRHFRH